MASQPGYGRQFDKTHAVTVLAQEDIAKHRFVTYAGKQATGTQASAAAFVQGVSEEAATSGEALSVITGYSALVEVGAGGVTLGAWVKPDANGRAVAGTNAEHCGRALGTGTQPSGSDYYLVEVEILKHIKITEGAG